MAPQRVTRIALNRRERLIGSDKRRGAGPMRREFLRVLAIAGSAVALGGLSGSAAQLPSAPTLSGPPTDERRATFYTTSKIRSARANISAHPWAAEIERVAISGAAKLVAASDEWVWSALPGQGLPRSFAVNQDLGSPISGHALYKYGAYPWRADPFDQPWKLTDPSSGYVFPTNDFGAFYKSALDQNGNFDRALADTRLLVNTAYPERGPAWGVDDGFGWVDDKGDKWTFIAYYAHWFIWYGGLAYSALQAARDAFLYTGLTKYAHTGLILLDRIADLYPTMDTGPYRREDGYLNSGGLTEEGNILGKAVGNVWETQIALNLASSYDAFYPMIADADHANVVHFLHQKSRLYGLKPKKSAADVRANIEEGILRQVYPAVKNSQIRGNFGMHQCALVMAAVALDDPRVTEEWIDFVFGASGLTNEGALAQEGIKGGNLGATLVNAIDRDGWGTESPGYNQIWIDHVVMIANILDGYGGHSAPSLWDHPKVRAMVKAGPSLTMLGSYTPSIGDSGQVGNAGVLGTAAAYVTAFERYQDPVLAQAAYHLNSNSVHGLHTTIFDPNPEANNGRIERVVEKRGRLSLRSQNLTGFGLAAMRRVGASDGHEALVYYGQTADHGHRDDLMLDVYGFGLDLASPLGYPQFMDRRALTVGLQTNTIGSNTVVVDKQPQLPQRETTAQPNDFVVTDGVQMADIEAPKVYVQASRYRRTTSMIKADARNTYYVDIFRIRGGSEHVYSFHTIGSQAAVEGLSLVRQATGTYAGPNIDPPADNAPGDWKSPGYEWMTAVSRGTPNGQFNVDWPIPDLYGVRHDGLQVGLRLTMLSAVDELAVADGRAATNKAAGNPATLRYMLAKRTGTDLSSQFVSVIEPYTVVPFIRLSRCVDVVAHDSSQSIAGDDVSAVRVELLSGRIDYVVSNLRPDVKVRVDNLFTFQGEFGVISLMGGAAVSAVTSGTTVVEFLETQETAMTGAMTGAVGGAQGSILGTVVGFARGVSEESLVTLSLATPVPPDYNVVGSYVYIANDGRRNAAYEVLGSRECTTQMTLTLRLRGSIVRSYISDSSPASGYLYDVAIGARARIPIHRAWHAG
jgi:hypothetical protein